MTIAEGVFKQSGLPDQLIPLAVDADGKLATTATATMSGEIEIKNDSSNPVLVSYSNSITTVSLLTSTTAVLIGPVIPGIAKQKTYMVKGQTSSGVGEVTVDIQGSVDGTVFDTIGTFTLSLTTTTRSDSNTSEDRYPFLRGVVVAISGTNASVSLAMGY